MTSYEVRYWVRGRVTYTVEAASPEAAMAATEALTWAAGDLDFDIEEREVLLDGEPVPYDWEQVEELQEIAGASGAGRDSQSVVDDQPAVVCSVCTGDTRRESVEEQNGAWLCADCQLMEAAREAAPLN